MGREGRDYWVAQLSVRHVARKIFPGLQESLRNDAAEVS